MKRIMVLVLALVLFASFAFAASNTYQVTGPVVDVKSDSITVKKGSENWQIAVDKDTKINGEPKVGSKVTVHYTMKATSVELKGDKKEVKKAADKKTALKKK